jgi:hypothetical protein
LIVCIVVADIIVEAAPVIIAAAATTIALTSDSHYHEETPEEREAVVTWFLAIAATVSTAGAAAAPYSTGGSGGVSGENIAQPTTDPVTGVEVGRIVGDANGNNLIEPVGGSTTSSPNGQYIQTRYPDGSYYQRYDGVPYDPHGHGYFPPGQPIDINGNPVEEISPEAHWKGR